MRKRGKNKKAQANIIVVILIIAIVIVAVVIVYNVVRIFTKEKLPVKETLEVITVGLEIKSAYIVIQNDSTIISIYRRPGKGDISSLKFIFTDSSGNNYVYTYPNPEGSPDELETKVYEINASWIPDLNDFSEIISVSIAFTVKTESGKEITSTIKDTFKEPPDDLRDPSGKKQVNTPSGGGGGNGGPPPCVPNCAGKVCGDDGCGGSCPPGCEPGFECIEGDCIEEDNKDKSKYSEKEVFLISDKNWKKVLPLVPLVIWTTRPGKIEKHPILIYHEEESLEPVYNIPYAMESGEYYEKAYSINGKSLVRFYLEGKSKEEFLKLNLDVASIGEGYVDVILTEKQKNYFEDMGFNLETMPINTEKLFGGKEGYDSDYNYHTYEETIKELNDLESDYPNIAKVYEIGKSIQNRSILAMKISDNVETEENETEILVVGNHHAREIMTVEVPIFMINYLLKNYDIDSEIKKVVDSHELWLVPMVNPDGHVIVEKGEKGELGGDIWWRKNARDNNGDEVIDWNDGVDLNRNYGYTWAYDDIGSSPKPSSSTYRGTAAFSEPETQAIRDLILGHNFSYVLDYHSAGGYILYPWGHIDEPTPDDGLFKNLSEMFKIFVPQYTAGQISDVMYYSNGDSIDWHYGEQENKSKIIAFGFELNPQGGFRPPVSYIKPTSEKQLMVLLNLTGYLINFTYKKFDVDSIIYFLQQYSPDRVTVIGNTSQELDDLLVAEPEAGAGLDLTQIQRINPEDYLSYWSDYLDIVYVEDDYELALLASTYASLIDAPLIIQGTDSDKAEIFSGKRVICVGNVTPNESACYEDYNLEQLQQKYLNETGTTKIILTNPEDLEIYAQDSLDTKKSIGEINNVYGKTSLAAPILASAKHELIIFDDTKEYIQVDKNIKDFSEENYKENITSCLFSEVCASGFENHPVEMEGTRNSITFFLRGNPDIYIDEIDHQTIFKNKTNNLIVFIKNSGFDLAENCVLSFYEINESGPGPKGNGGTPVPIPEPPYSSYSSEFILVDTVNIGDILEDELVNATLTWTPTKVGSTTLWFNVSTSSNESNLNNNGRMHWVYVEGPAPDVSVSVDYSDRMLVDSVNIFNVSVTNIGSEIATNINLSFYEEYWKCNRGGCSQNLVLIDNILIDFLNPDEQQKIEFNFTPTELMWYNFLVKAEVDDDVNLWNNEFYFSSRAVTSEPLIWYYYNTPYPFIVNESHEINLTLWNEGFETAQNTVIDFYIREPGEVDYKLNETRNIGEISEEDKKISFNYTPTKLGGHRLFFNVSYDYSGGSGNKEIWIWREVKLPGPDVSVWVYAKNVELGQENLAEIWINNEGNEIANNINYTFYDNDKIIEQGSINSLNPMDGEDIEVRWTPEGIGEHELKVIVNCSEDIDLENNIDYRWIYVYTLKNVTFHITNNTDHISRYLGIAHDWDYPEDIYFVDKQTTLSIPDLDTDVWIIKSEEGLSEDYEYVFSRFISSNLSDNAFVISEYYDNVRLVEDKRLYRIYANEVFWNYDWHTITFNYPDYPQLGITNPENLTIYYCLDWDFDYGNCSTGWEEASWFFQYIEGNHIQLGTDAYSAEAFALGEYVAGGYGAEIREREKFDISNLKKEYENRIKLGPDPIMVPDLFGEFGSYYSLRIPGFFHNCSGNEVNVNISFNEEKVGEYIVDCYNNLPFIEVEESLGGYFYYKAKNITLNFNADLIFYNSSEMIELWKYNSYFSFGEQDSTGLQTKSVDSFVCDNQSEFIFKNKNYTYFVINAQSRPGSSGDLDIYLNDELIGELDLSNSNGKKGRGFSIPEHLLGEEKFNISLKSKTSGLKYIADVKTKTDFDPYYLTIFASPEAIPFKDDYYSEADFRKYGDLDGDKEGEFSVGRIMGITLSDVSAYLSRVLFYDDLEKKKGATMMMVGDGYSQGIPSRTCGTGFCECYFDVECEELFSRYEDFFEPFITCNQDLINGTPQEPPSDCENVTMLQDSVFYNSSFSMFGDHGSPTGWAHTLYTEDLENLVPQFSYSFACSTCAYGYVKSGLFCTNMIRRGAMGYIGAVASMYGHHFLNEFLDETLINNKSIGYAFKVGKNKEVRYDWMTPNVPEYADLRENYGVHDILIGDPTFNGRFGK